MNNHVRMRNQRYGLETSTSPYALANGDFGILESLILYTVTALAPGLSNAAIAGITTALTSLATTAIVTGIQYLLMPKPPKPADGKAPKKQAVPPVIFGVGTNRVGGYDMLWEASGNNLFEVLAVAGHQISAIQRIYIGDAYITTFDGTTGTIADIFEPGGTICLDTNIGDGRYINVATMAGRLGVVPETPYDFIVDSLSSQGIWTNNHRGDGQASLGFRFRGGGDRQGKRYPGGLPQPSAVLDMAMVYDWRDPDQVHDDPTTWKFSRNAALCMIWWLCHSQYGPRWSFVKSILPVLDRWTEEADICDEEVPLAIGGTEPRYEVNGWATTETDPVAILNSFLAACDGHLAQHGDGTLILTTGKFREELVETITDADIIGHTIQYDVQEEDEVNRLVPKFTYPATDYTSAIADYFESVEDQSTAGRVLAQDADLSWVQRWRQARRLTLREWRRIQQKVSGTFDLRLSAINAVYARWIRLETPVRLPRLNGVLAENRRATMALQQGGFQMEWKKHPENIDDWNPVTDEGAAPPVPPRPASSELPIPVIDTLIAISNGSSVYLRCAVLAPSEDGLIPALRYRIADFGDGEPGAWSSWQDFPDVEASAGLLTLDSAPVPTDTLLDVQAAFKGSGGSYGDGSDPPEQILTTVDTTAPVGLESFSTTDGAGQFYADISSVNDAHLVTVAIYRVSPGDPAPAVADTPAARPAVSPGVGYAVPVTAPTGTWDIYARPFNRSNIAGPLAGPETVTVT
jgi:hypothetical protein